MRIAIAEIGQETDTFSALPTTLELFESHGLFHGEEILKLMAGVGMLGGFLEVMSKQNQEIEVLPIIRAWAGAGGTITTETLDYFEKKLVAGLKAALPLDGFFFALHGAAAADKDDDLEGYLLEAARSVIGPDVPIVSPLDHHANVTQRMVDLTTLIVGHRTQPHNNFDTGRIAAELFFSILRGEVKPTVGFCKIPMITQQDQFLTSGGPMKEWFDSAFKLEKQKDVLTASPFPMQPWLDVKEGGWTSLVYTDNQPDQAQKLADQMADHAWNMRDRFWESSRVPADDAVRQAVGAPGGLIILSDTGDSVYGGAPGDSTCILTELGRQKVSQIALVSMFDPEAQAKAMKAGIGSEVTLEVGGKIDDVFSKPLTVMGKVIGLSRGLEVKLESRAFTDIGPTALIEIGGIRLVLQSQRTFAVNQPILYTHLGLSIDDAKMVVLKTASNFQFFERWTKTMIRVDSPGTTQSDLTAFTWENLSRPVHPIDDITEWRASGL